MIIKISHIDIGFENIITMIDIKIFKNCSKKPETTSNSIDPTISFN
jgi:hypothetical protein